MNQPVEEITDKLIGAIKTDKSFYTPKDLLSSGFPNFIVEQIRLTINENIRGELNIPATVWVDWENPLVQESWEYFRQVVLSNSRLPKDKLYAVVHEVIDQLLSIYLEPRKYLADYIYQEKHELSFEEMVECTGQLTIQKHFGRALPLYMQKRKLEILEKGRCQLLIQKLDANMVASYTPEDWVGALQSVFVLCGGRIPSSLLHKFFADKNIIELAEKFKTIDRKFSKEDLLKILSGADLIEKVPTKKLKKEEQKDKSDPAPKKTQKVDAHEQKLMDNFSSSYNSDEYVDDGSINALFRSQSDKSIFSGYDETSETKTQDERKKDESGRFHENLTSVLDMAAHSFKSISGDDADEADDNVKHKKPGMPEKNKQTENADRSKAEKEEGIAKKDSKDVENTIEKPDETVEAAEESDEAVIWQNFLTKEHRDTLLWKPGMDEDEDDGAILISEEDIFDETPPFSDVKLKKEPIKQKEELRVFLMGQEVYLIEELFGGSEDAYVKALNEINQFENWEKASDYILSKIFSTNKIDMYSEAAVEFIDQLQSYFQEYKN